MKTLLQEYPPATQKTKAMKPKPRIPPLQIVVKLKSGLGNQLFQYAAAKYYAKKHNASVRVATQLHKTQFHKGLPRPLGLTKFSIAAELTPLTYFDRLVLSTNPRICLIGELARKANKIEVLREPFNDRYYLNSALQVHNEVRVAYLDGYWQVFQLVFEMENDLRKEISLRDQPSGRNLDVARQIAAADNPVSVHLRRGDYAATFGPEAVLPISYYDRAVRTLADRFGRVTPIIFSDDIPAAKAWAAGKPNCIVVDHNDAYSAHEDLRLMSLCKHHIIANSSFSWWGAWLNPCTEKHVIAPSNWLGFETAKIGIADPRWQLLHS